MKYLDTISINTSNQLRRYVPDTQKYHTDLPGTLAALGNFGIYNFAVAKQIGIEEQVVLAYLISKYNLYEKTDQLTSFGTYYCTRDTMIADLNIKGDKQNKILKKLEYLNLLEVILIGYPAKRYFKLKPENIISLYQTE